jgi:hypothetical protein
MKRNSSDLIVYSFIKLVFENRNGLYINGGVCVYLYLVVGNGERLRKSKRKEN